MRYGGEPPPHLRSLAWDEDAEEGARQQAEREREQQREQQREYERAVDAFYRRAAESLPKEVRDAIELEHWQQMKRK